MTKLGFLRIFRIFRIFSAISALFVLGSGCLSPTTTLNKSNSSTTSNTTTSTTSTLTPASGPRAVRIIFKQAAEGSFDAPPSAGTTKINNGGLAAVRLFAPDGSSTPIASGGPTASGWPQWLQRFEIGISGSNNGVDSDCARFAGNTESTVNSCNWGAGANTAKCGAPSNYYRISEYDCAQTPSAADGSGQKDDPVYLRAFFSRNSAYLNSSENIMVTIEYTASAVNAGPSNLSNCFGGAGFAPENQNCSDQTWKAFIKSQSDSYVQPFLLFIPPSFSHVNTTAQTGGSNGTTTKQFILPLAAYPNVDTFQLSRIRALDPSNTAFQAACGTNSPLCLGVIFYSITFYRI